LIVDLHREATAEELWDATAHVPPFFDIRFIRVIWGSRFQKRKMPDEDLTIRHPAFSR
jgi:hypothetical protein